MPSVNRLLAMELIYRAVGQQTPGTVVKFCAKSVDRLLASKGLKELGLTTVETRRKRGDLTEAFKIIKFRGC